MTSRLRIVSPFAFAATVVFVMFPMLSEANGQGIRLGNGMRLNLGSGNRGGNNSGSLRSFGTTRNLGSSRSIGSQVLETFRGNESNGTLGSSRSTIQSLTPRGSSSVVRGIGGTTSSRYSTSSRQSTGRSSVSPLGLALIVQAATGVSLRRGATRTRSVGGSSGCILNPAPAPVVPPVVDAHPVVNVENPPPPAPLTEEERAREHVLAARVAFQESKYPEALTQMDAALKLVPKNKDARQFKSLIHFATQDYKPAAAEAYDAVLLGPIWTWETIRGLYQDKARYSDHYLQLQKAAGTSPESMETQFLLAYHHLALGHLAYGEKQLRRVLEINPKEPVSQQLLQVVIAMQKEPETKTVSTPK